MKQKIFIVSINNLLQNYNYFCNTPTIFSVKLRKFKLNFVN